MPSMDSGCKFAKNIIRSVVRSCEDGHLDVKLVEAVAWMNSQTVLGLVVKEA